MDSFVAALAKRGQISVVTRSTAPPRHNMMCVQFVRVLEALAAIETRQLVAFVDTQLHLVSSVFVIVGISWRTHGSPSAAMAGKPGVH